MSLNFFFGCIFAIHFLDMKTVEKVIDEKIQGKALVTENKKENTKKLFIGSYGC